MDKIKCTVEEDRFGNLTVTFDDNTNIYLQTDYQKAQFGVDCGLFSAPDNWDGCPSNLFDGWWEYDMEEITSCPDHYKNSAE